jgi:hypothetical protein
MYMAVVREALHDRYAGNGAGNGSLFDRLRHILPDLDRAEYRTRHRARLEYLHELAHERTSARLRKEYP